MPVNWAQFGLALRFAIVVLLVMNLAQMSDEVWVAVGISALLAWVTGLLGHPPTLAERVVGQVVFLLGGAALTALGHLSLPSEAVQVLLLGAVSFVCALLALRGGYWHIVGWCLTFWFLMAPGFSEGVGLRPVIEAHLIGAGMVLLWSLSVLLRARRQAQQAEAKAKADLAPDDPPRPPAPASTEVLTYAVVIAGAMMLALTLGLRLLESDATVIAAAALNVIGLCVKRTLAAAVERVLFATLGVVVGFYLGLSFQTPFVEQLVIAGASFLALAFLDRSFAPTVCAFAILSTYFSGQQGYDTANLLANEKLLGEALGASLAVAMMWSMAHLRLRYLPQYDDPPP